VSMSPLSFDNTVNGGLGRATLPGALRLRHLKGSNETPSPPTPLPLFDWERGGFVRVPKLLGETPCASS
jgi:hypothetical protein